MRNAECVNPIDPIASKDLITRIYELLIYEILQCISFLQDVFFYSVYAL